MSLTGFSFHTWSRNLSHRGSGIKIFTFVDTSSQFLCYLYVKVGPVSEQESCALIGYPRMQFPTLIAHRRKWRNACSLLNTSYNFVTKQYIFVLWIKASPAFLSKTEVTDSTWTKQKSQRNSQIHLVIPWCMNIFSYRVIDPLIRCWRSLGLGPG